MGGSIWRPAGDFSGKSPGVPSGGPTAGSLMMMGVGLSIYGFSIVLAIMNYFNQNSWM
jgi:hypothetical protein